MLNIKTLIAIDIDEYRLSKINRELDVKNKKFNYVNPNAVVFRQRDISIEN